MAIRHTDGNLVLIFERVRPTAFSAPVGCCRKQRCRLQTSALKLAMKTSLTSTDTFASKWNRHRANIVAEQAMTLFNRNGAHQSLPFTKAH